MIAKEKIKINKTLKLERRQDDDEQDNKKIKNRH
jgi:hypothetical protein